MYRVKVALDPALEQQFGPEIKWVLRYLLSGIGYAWQQVPLDDALCDLAYVLEANQGIQARLRICANRAAWQMRSQLRLSSIAQVQDWQYLRYENLPSAPLIEQQREQGLLLQHDLIFDCFWLLSGQEEIHWPKREHGYADLSDTNYLASGTLRLALASQIGSDLQSCFSRLGFTSPIARWPYGKRLAASAGHDVDYPQIIRWIEPLRIIQRQGLSGLKPALEVAAGAHTHWHFGSWMRLEQQLGSRSAFYFVARQGSLREYASGLPDPFYAINTPAFQRLFSELRDAGFEIGLHASYNAYQSKARFAAEKDWLEQISGQAVVGNRHHYWHLDPGQPENTLYLHEQIGLHYDSSLFHDQYLGWRRGSTWPFFPFYQQQRRQLGTLQMPTAWMDDQLFGQRHTNPGDRAELLNSLVQQVAAQAGCLLVDIHEYVYDQQLFPGWAATYQQLWQQLAARGDVWFATPAQIAQHWIDRYRTLERMSSGLEGAM
jgi:hypothetical protein